MKKDVGKSSVGDQEDQHRSYQIEILNRETGRVEAKVVDLDREQMQAPDRLKGHLGREAKDFVRRSGMSRENIKVNIKRVENPALQMGRRRSLEMERVQ